VVRPTSRHRSSSRTATSYASVASRTSGAAAAIHHHGTVYASAHSSLHAASLQTRRCARWIYIPMWPTHVADPCGRYRCGRPMWPTDVAVTDVAVTDVAGRCGPPYVAESDFRFRHIGRATLGVPHWGCHIGGCHIGVSHRVCCIGVPHRVCCIGIDPVEKDPSRTASLQAPAACKLPRADA
jgi:hypothetical protein